MDFQEVGMLIHLDLTIRTVQQRLQLTALLAQQVAAARNHFADLIPRVELSPTYALYQVVFDLRWVYFIFQLCLSYLSLALLNFD